MNKKEYLEFHKNFCEQMTEITKKKNSDYTGATDDPFANFRQIGNLVQSEHLDIVSVGFLTRMSDKFSRIGSFISRGELLVKDESVTDSLQDLCNYAILFSGYLKSKQRAESGQIKDQSQ